MIRRRDLIAMLGGAAVVASHTARAQPNDRVRLIGVLAGLAPDDPGFRRNFAGFVAGLKEAGWVEGQNVRFEIRGVPGGLFAASFQTAARELVSLAPDAILAVPMTAAQALLQNTHTIPIVFELSTDPVAEGLVASVAHPGGNATGFTQSEYSLGGKWLQLLKQMAPEMNRVGVVLGVDTASMQAVSSTDHLYIDSMMGAGRSLAVAVTEITVHAEAEIEPAITAFAQQPHGGLLCSPDTFTIAHRAPIVELAARLRLPAIYFSRIFVADGGLFSYGVDQVDLFRQGGGYVDRILRGMAPADLPVQAPKKFELVINMKTAQALGITVPPLLLTGADEVIE